MAKIISLINLKGGVGKTTLTIALADFLSVKYKQRVLVVDLDPQTNATISLINQEKWTEVNKENNTLHQLYLDKIENTKAFKIEKSILKDVGNLRDSYKLDLLPSSIDLIDMIEDIIKIEDEKKKIEILDKEIEKVKEDYDYILIDCPPDLSSITMTGLYSSEKYIIPIIPDPLSVYGLNQLIRKIENKVRVIKRTKSDYNCVPIGIIVNRYTGTQAQRNIKESLEAREGKDLPKIFKSNIKALDKIGRLSEEVQGKTTIKEKYKNGYNDLENLVKEIIDEV